MRTSTIPPRHGRRALMLAAAFSPLAVAGTRRARAQSQGAAAYPDRPVRLVVPYSAGGVADTLARMVQPKVGEHEQSGQRRQRPVVVEEGGRHAEHATLADPGAQQVAVVEHPADVGQPDPETLREVGDGEPLADEGLEGVGGLRGLLGAHGSSLAHGADRVRVRHACPDIPEAPTTVG